MIGLESRGHDAEQFIRDLIDEARAAVNDCRIDYVEMQVAKEDLDEWVQRFGVPPIDWHPEPCSHPQANVDVVVRETEQSTGGP